MIISIPKQIINSSIWKDHLYIYALSRACVGISPNEVLEWKIVALHWEDVKFALTPKTIKFKFPLILYNFYNLVQPEIKFSLSGDRHGNSVLMIIEYEGSKVYNPNRRGIKYALSKRNPKQIRFS